LVAPAASRVSVVGDFNDWDAGATPLARMAGGGVWTVEVPLSAGRHVYTFVVDGKRWVSDPSAPADNDDDFGRPNSVVTVAGV
jgi:1,4-alpha-glucan branching enzyme